jgi:hypothetical protein
VMTVTPVAKQPSVSRNSRVLKPGWADGRLTVTGSLVVQRSAAQHNLGTPELFHDRV